MLINVRFNLLSPMDVTKMWLGSHMSFTYQCYAEYQHFNFSLMVFSSSSIQFQVSLNKKNFRLVIKQRKEKKECPQTIRPFLDWSLYRPIPVWFLLLCWRSKGIIVIMTQFWNLTVNSYEFISNVYTDLYWTIPWDDLYCELYAVRSPPQGQGLSSF